MAKAASSIKDQEKLVPAAELVGDHANKQSPEANGDASGSGTSATTISDGENNAPAIVRITSKKDGFRRAGMAHIGTADYPVDTFSDIQLEQLLAEPMLVVQMIGEGADE